MTVYTDVPKSSLFPLGPRIFDYRNSPELLAIAGRRFLVPNKFTKRQQQKAAATKAFLVEAVLCGDLPSDIVEEIVSFPCLRGA